MDKPRFSIEAYEFGRIQINGKTYTKDLIVHQEGIIENWWRKEGHSLYPEDLVSVIDLNPDILIIGVGAMGMLKIPAKTTNWVLEKGIELIEIPTKEASEKYNELSKTTSVVAGLHLTC
ncbi:MAG: MTH938/NDUFAF3 family protein [Myxococcota bacterium]|nr:MTH938/NDUFAF3 family protein [Myxococcota bacterium]